MTSPIGRTRALPSRLARPARSLAADSGGTRAVTLDLGKCTFCGLCAEADPAIRMTNVCELAAQAQGGPGDHRQVRTRPRRRARRSCWTISPSTLRRRIAAHRLDDRSAPELKARIDKVLGRSLHIREVDAGSCNGCEMEIVGLNSPVYDIERFGIHFVASPRHADMLLVTGPVTRNMELALRKTYDAMPAPRLVVAVGACGCSGGIFGQNYASLRRRGQGRPRGCLYSRLPAQSARAAARHPHRDRPAVARAFGAPAHQASGVTRPLSVLGLRPSFGPRISAFGFPRPLARRHVACLRHLRLSHRPPIQPFKPSNVI